MQVGHMILQGYVLRNGVICAILDGPVGGPVPYGKGLQISREFWPKNRFEKWANGPLVELAKKQAETVLNNWPVSTGEPNA